MATHSSILAWKIPWATIHGVAKSHNWLSDFTFTFKLWKSLCNRTLSPPFLLSFFNINISFLKICYLTVSFSDFPPVLDTWFHIWSIVLSSLESFYLPAAAAAAKSLQSCPTLCDPIDGSPPGSPVPGILQARTLEWVAISFSNAWKWKVKVKSLSCVWPSATPSWTAAFQAPPSMGFLGKSTGVGCHCLLPTLPSRMQLSYRNRSLVSGVLCPNHRVGKKVILWIHTYVTHIWALDTFQFGYLSRGAKGHPTLASNRQLFAQVWRLD